MAEKTPSEVAMDEHHLAPRPSAEAIDPVLEALKKDLDLTLIQRNLRLTVEQRAEQLMKAAGFIRKFRPLAQKGRKSE